MSRKTIILLLLLFSVPITNIHRFLNSSPVDPMSFPLNPNVTTDIQWYILDVCTMLSFVFILAAFVLYIFSDLQKDKDCIILILTVLTVALVDIVHYVLWFKQNEWVLIIESIILISGTIIMLLRHGEKIKAIGNHYYYSCIDFFRQLFL